MESVDFSIKESKSMVSYDRSAPEIKSLASNSFSFRIDPDSDNPGQAVAVFEVRDGENVVRRNDSLPFPEGTFETRNVDVNKTNCNVTLRKANGATKLGTYFQ